MRLSCPNCETEYEVHENMIPAEGRDVQCSNCMRTWFQGHASQAAETDETDNDGQAHSNAAEVEAQHPTLPVTGYEDSDDDDDDDEPDFPSRPPAAIAALAAQRSSAKIDPEALGVIKDEVVREQMARKSDAGTIETQIDLGIDDTETKDRATAARGRMRSKGDPADLEDKIEDIDADLDAALAAVVKDSHPAETGTKRDMLPDIEEINSTLKEAPDYDDFEDDAIEASNGRHPKMLNRRGFRLGFGLMLLLAAALVGLFVYAPAISRSVPAMAEGLSTYVDFVNGFRGWLDGSAQDLVDQITKLLGAVS